MKLSVLENVRNNFCGREDFRLTVFLNHNVYTLSPSFNIIWSSFSVRSSIWKDKSIFLFPSAVFELVLLIITSYPIL